MKQYFAISGPTEIITVLTGRYKNALVSFYYYKGSFRDKLLKYMPYFDSFIMDSGAFQAWLKNKEISLDEYEKTLKDDNIKKYFSLDSIGNAKDSFENYLEMKKRGLNPIPTFHINTDINYLYKYLDLTDHISIGGMVGGDKVEDNLLKIWAEILKINPEAKVHGLGVSNFSTASAYPWHSIDSSSWCSITKFARTSLWNSKKNKFHTKDTVTEFLPELSIFPEDGKLTGYVQLLWIIQQEHYNQMIDSINEYQKEKDFNFLTNQQTLF